MNRRIVHGTYSTYFWNNCRCDLCRENQAARNRRNRARQLATGNLNHGTRSAYDAGCRCDACRGARREAYLRLDSERKP